MLHARALFLVTVWYPSIRVRQRRIFENAVRLRSKFRFLFFLFGITEVVCLVLVILVPIVGLNLNKMTLSEVLQGPQFPWIMPIVELAMIKYAFRRRATVVVCDELTSSFAKTLNC